MLAFTLTVRKLPEIEFTILGFLDLHELKRFRFEFN